MLSFLKINSSLVNTPISKLIVREASFFHWPISDHYFDHQAISILYLTIHCKYIYIVVLYILKDENILVEKQQLDYINN